MSVVTKYKVSDFPPKLVSGSARLTKKSAIIEKDSPLYESCHWRTRVPLKEVYDTAQQAVDAFCEQNLEKIDGFERRIQQLEENNRLAKLLLTTPEADHN